MEVIKHLKLSAHVLFKMSVITSRVKNKTLIFSVKKCRTDMRKHTII